MIKFNIVAVGKLKEKYWTEAVAEYIKRLGRYASADITECPECADEGQTETILNKEAAGILKKLKGYVVLTDIGGEEMTSEGLAEFIDKTAARGISEFTFVIGGSRGVADSVRQAADKRISFGRVTYPHQLMRVILTEQLYRAMSIINNTAYHK